MNIVQISNLFNQVCQSINVSTPGRVGFYHFGWYSDINVFSEFNRVGRTAPYQIGFQGPVTTDYISDQHNDSLCLLKCDFTIWYQMDCPIDVVDIANLPIDFNDIPPSINDYELL